MIGEIIGLVFVIGFMLFCLVGVGFIIADSNYDKKRKDDWLVFEMGWSCFIILAICFRTIPDLKEVDLILSFIGCFMWTLVGLMWNDRALIVLNAVATFVLLTGIIKLFI